MEAVNSVNEIGKEFKPFSFANVRKETAGETFKCLNKLLKSKSFEDVENFKEIVSPSAPLSAFNEKLRLILIDSLHLEDEVVKVLLSQDDFSIKRVLNCKWFFQNLTLEFCKNELFPKISTSLRYKIINRVSKYIESDEEAEKFFMYIQSNFGSEEAEILLPKCSSAFILNYCKKIRPLIEYSTNNRKRILKHICLRYPETGLHILSLVFDYKKNYDSYELTQCNALLQYYAGNHIDLFIPFFKKYASQIKSKCFGGKLSWFDNFLPCKRKEDVFQESRHEFDSFIKLKVGKRLKDFLFESKEIINDGILHEKYLFSKLDTDDQIKFLSIIVQMKEQKLTFRNWTKASSRLANLIKCIPQSNRLAVITSVFKEVYCLNFQDHSKCWSVNFLNLLSAKERRYFVEILEGFHKASEVEFRENVDTTSFTQLQPENLYCLYEFDIAFDKLKSIIIKSPDKFRRQLIVSEMVKCCSVNKDLKGLEQVLDFVGTRHRNDDPEIISGMAVTICDMFPASKLTLNICQKVSNLLLLCNAKGFFDQYSFSRMMERAIYLSWDSNKQTDDLFKKYFELSILKHGSYMAFLSDYKNKHSRRLLLAVGEEIKNWFQTHPSDYASQQLHYTWIHTCEQFNKCNDNKVVLKDVPGMAESFREFLKTKHDKMGVEDWPIDAMKTCDVRLFSPPYESRFLCYLIKRNPEVIMKHLDKIMQRLERQFYHLLKKQFLFLGEIDKMKEIILNVFKNGNNVGERTTALWLYSHLCTIEEYSDAVAEYIPQDDHIKEGSDLNFTQIQLVVPTAIKNIRPRWKNLNLILKFFRGDFLKPVMWSFYASCYYSRIDFILPFLREHLFTVPQRISYTKDVIRLICEFSNRDEKINFCLKCWEENKHYSIRRIILQFLSKLFLEDPNRELFDALTKCLLESEAIIIDVRPEFRKIPDEFVNDYTAILWRLSEKPDFKENFQRTIISYFNPDNINLLSEEFCEEIIRNNLFNHKSAISVEQFAAFYSVAKPDATSDRVEMILKLIRQRQCLPQNIASFLTSIRNLSLTSPDKFTNIFSIFLKNWPEIHGLYEEKLHYTYHDLYYRTLQTSNEPSIVSVNFGQQLRTLYTAMKDLKDLTIILGDTLRKFMDDVIRAKLPFEPLLLVKELIESGERSLAIISIAALPSHIVDLYKEEEAFNTNGDRKKLDEIVRIFENKNDEVLWIYFRRRFGYKTFIM